MFVYHQAHLLYGKGSTKNCKAENYILILNAVVMNITESRQNILARAIKKIKFYDSIREEASSFHKGILIFKCTKLKPNWLHILRRLK